MHRTYRRLVGLVPAAMMFFATAALAGDATVAGTATAGAPSSTWIAASSPFSGDDNLNGYTIFEIGTAPGGPFDMFNPQLVPGSEDWRRVSFIPLDPATAHWVRMTYVDPDGVSGANPQIVGPVSTLAAAPNAVRLLPATVEARDTEIYVSVPVADDANHNSSTPHPRFEISTTGGDPWTTKCTGSSFHPKRCRIRGLVHGTWYWVRVTVYDADGVVGANPQVYGPILYNGATDLALGRPVSVAPDHGWGCCPNPQALVDGRIQHDNWQNGFAWWGGDNHYAGGPAGWKNATVDFGAPTSFNRAVMWFHDSQSLALDWKFQVSDDAASWTDVASFSEPVCRAAYVGPPQTSVGWTFPSCGHDVTFPRVTARYLRYDHDDRTLASPGLHGWASELEVFDITTTCSDGDGDGWGDPGDPSCREDGRTDCDDTRAEVHPDAVELCDGLDNNCDGATDEGFDVDGDGIADCFDPDDDNDGVADAEDWDAFDPDLCRDLDGDGCDDCAVGTDDFGPLADANPADDGPDHDGDGLCDAGDPDDDNDGVADAADNCPLDANADQGDADGDGDGDACDPCFGADNGADADADGTCADLDPDDANADVTGFCEDDARALAEEIETVPLAEFLGGSARRRRVLASRAQGAANALLMGRPDIARARLDSLAALTDGLGTDYMVPGAARDRVWAWAAGLVAALDAGGCV